MTHSNPKFVKAMQSYKYKPPDAVEPTLDIEKFITKMFDQQAKEDEETVVNFQTDAGWVAAEIGHWKQRCEELEIELECMRNAFPEDDHDVSPKRRGIFGA